MPDMNEEKGLKGEPAKETWLPDVMKKEKASDPVPWTSIGTAPTEEQLHRNDYEGSA